MGLLLIYLSTLMIRTSLLILIISVVPLGKVLSQLPSQEATFRLAQSYEQSGNFEKSAQLYRQLNNTDPANYLFFDGLRRSYLQLKQYDDCILLMKNRLSSNTKDVNLHAMLGSVQYKAGLEKEASVSWQNAIGVDPANQNVYRIVTNSMLENRLLEKAAEVYRDARKAFKDDNLFTIDIAYLLSVSMDYAGATREYVRWIRNNPTQVGFVQGRMTQFTGKPEGRDAAIKVLREELNRGEDVHLYGLLGWVLLEGKQYDEAFEAYRTIDALSNAKGAQIYSFADRAYREQAYDVAARAYREAIELPVEGARLPAARYGYGNCLMQISSLTDTVDRITGASVNESHPTYSGAIAYFRGIIKDYPRSEYSARSYYQIGLLLFDRYFDLDGALTSFENVERELPGAPVLHYDVSLKIGEILVAKGDTARAIERFLPVAQATDATPDQADEAGFRLAEISYFGGNFKAAVDRLSEISFNLKANYANDALSLLSFLQENTATSEPALAKFAQADFLSRQRRNSEAIPIFLQVITEYPQALLVDDALMKVADLQATSGMYVEAIASYQRLLKEFKETSIALDRAQFRIAEIYDHSLHDNAAALTAYGAVLADYPESLLCPLVRKRIRTLRGESL